MDARQSFSESAAQSSCSFEMGFVIAGAVFFAAFTAGKLLAVIPFQNWTTAVTSGSIVAMHVATLMYRRRFPKTFWVPVLVGWLDCLMFSYSHIALQEAFWDTLYGPLAMGPHAPFDNSPPQDMVSCLLHCRLAASIQTTFILYVTISYMTTFVLQFAQGLLVNAVGIPLYFILVWFARGQVANHDILGTLVIEVVCLVLAALVCTLAKWRSDALSLQNFELVASEKKQTIFEKTLRCEAEFAMSNMQTPPRQVNHPSADDVSGPTLDDSGYMDSCAGSSCQPTRCRKPESLRSAPARLVSFLVDAQTLDPAQRGCEGADCLPTDATVWVEGEGAPCPLSSISSGQRILCYDSLSQGVRYTDVLRVQKLPEPSNWVVVTLADGTQLTMTADHQVKLAVESSTVLGGSFVQAQDLVPGTSAVMVHKVELKPVLVQSVRSSDVSRPSAEPGRMSVEVHHPEQYSILCAAPSSGAHANVRSVAVGSAAIQKIGLTEKNSFFHDCFEASTEQPAALCRSSSEPASQRLRQPRQSAQSQSPAGLQTASSGSHTTSTSRSMSSSSGADISVIPPMASITIGAPAAPSHAGAPVDVASLRAFDARGAGHLSVGSALHDAGQCKPCFFKSKVGGCSRGVTCGFCHRADGHQVKRVRGKRFYI